MTPPESRPIVKFSKTLMPDVLTSPTLLAGCRRGMMGSRTAAIALALAASFLVPVGSVGAQDLPSLEQLFAPTPAATAAPNSNGQATPTPNLVDGMPGMETLVPGAPLTTPVPSNLDVGAPGDMQAVVDRQQKRRQIDTLLSQIRENFAQGEFPKVLELIAEAEKIERDNPNIKFYKDWATKKIRTGEGALGAVINNPRLGGAQSTPDPSIPTPRAGRIPRLQSTPTPTPVATPLPVATPQPVEPPISALPAVPSVAPSGGFMQDYGPIAVAVAVGLAILGVAAYLLGRRTPIPAAPKIQYQPVPILPNLLSSMPVDANSATATHRGDHPVNQDPQTLAIEDDEPAMSHTPPPMSAFPGVEPGLFGQVGQGLGGAMPPISSPPQSPSMDILPTVDEAQDDTMYAIEEDVHVPLPDPEDNGLEATAYDFYEARTQEMSLDTESTQINPGPLPPSSFGTGSPDDIELTIPLGGPLPPSRFGDLAPVSSPAATPSTPTPAPAPVPPAALDVFSFDPDITMPVASSLPPSKFPEAPITRAPAAPVPAEPEDDIIATPLLDLPMGDAEPSAPVIPKQLLGVFPGKSKASAPAEPKAPEAKAPVPKAPEPPAPAPATPVLPPSVAGNDSVIDLGAMGISFGSSTPAAPAPKPVEKPKPAEPSPSPFAGFDKITFADAPTPLPGSFHPDEALAATADMSPYQADQGLSATKTQAGFEVGSDSIYGNPSMSEAEQSAEMVKQEVARGDKAAAAGDWKKAVHYYSIAASIQTDHPELVEKLRHAREMKKQAEGH